MDVNLLSQINFEQLDFENLGAYGDWIHGTLIPKAMDMVDRYCRHNFQDNVGTIYVDGRSRETVHVTSAGVVTQWPDGYPEFPIGLLPVPLMEVTAISIDGVAQTLANFFTYNTHVAYENCVFCEGRQNVVITARFGYGTIPHDIQYVTAQLCAHIIADMVRMRKMPDLITPVLEGGGNLNMLFRSPNV
ncbi:unnamed protein product, partial [marine sediment metagenome]